MTRVFEIRIKGHLSAKGHDWLEAMSMTLEEDGTTLLAGPVLDQPALFGLLRKVRDLGLPLISVNQAADTLNRQNPNEKGETKQ